MTIHSCDKCQKRLDTVDSRYTVGQLWVGAELCGDCVQPYLELLHKERLLPSRLADILIKVPTKN